MAERTCSVGWSGSARSIEVEWTDIRSCLRQPTVDIHASGCIQTASPNSTCTRPSIAFHHFWTVEGTYAVYLFDLYSWLPHQMSLSNKNPPISHVSVFQHLERRLDPVAGHRPGHDDRPDSVQRRKSQHAPDCHPRSNRRALDPDAIRDKGHNRQRRRFVADGQEVNGAIAGDQRESPERSVMLFILESIPGVTDLEKSGAEFAHQRRCVTCSTSVRGTPFSSV